MNHRSSNYEQLYGVSLLDDLHNYFPALLYDSDSFRTVEDVLQYVSLQTRRRFDLFSFGLSAYEEMNGGARRASGGAGATNAPDYQFYTAPGQRSRQNPLSPPAGSPAGPGPGPAPPPPPAPARASQNRHYQYVFEFGEDQPEIYEPTLSPTILTTLLAGLQPRMRTNRMDDLSTLANVILRLGSPPGQALDPVVVRPTAAQLTRATEVLTPETEQDCAICQDTITVSQQCRKILHCGHWFHKDCIDPWFQQNVQCPICRYDIRDDSASQILEEETA